MFRITKYMQLALILIGVSQDSITMSLKECQQEAFTISYFKNKFSFKN